MNVTPIASDSMGTRSMATFVETKDVSVLIDPSVALGPTRYRLPPHPLEIKKMEEDWKTVLGYSGKADVVVITHYHYDHHSPSNPDIFKLKSLFFKHPKEKINLSQKTRAKFFLEQIKGFPASLEYSDGREFSFGDTTLRFSSPVFHGTNSRLGYVTELSIREGDSCFVFTSDVEGPSIEDQVRFILEEDPTILYLDGPLSYMLGYRYSQKSLDASIRNMVRIIEETMVEMFLVDHHLLRDLKWRDRINDVYVEARKKGVELQTAAEFLGKENAMLEARRKELYKEHPV
jgi:predicted metallo-beta-lactamase superfamily hydrolase